MANDGSNEYKAAKPMVWIKANDGDTYICPKNEIDDPRNVSEAELSRCVNESENPQNN